MRDKLKKERKRGFILNRNTNKEGEGLRPRSTIPGQPLELENPHRQSQSEQYREDLIANTLF